MIPLLSNVAGRSSKADVRQGSSPSEGGNVTKSDERKRSTAVVVRHVRDAACQGRRVQYRPTIISILSQDAGDFWGTSTNTNTARPPVPKQAYVRMNRSPEAGCL